MRAVKSADLKVLRRELRPKELEEIYMNARYNLRPLYYDAKGIVEVIAYDMDKPERQTFRSRMAVQKHASASERVVVHPHSSCYITADLVKNASVEVTCRAGVLTQVSRAAYSQLLGLDAIVETAWDLTPFSFIADWFWDIGGTIGAWTPQMGFKDLASWVTTKQVITQKTVLGQTYVEEKNAPLYKVNGLAQSFSGGSIERVLTTFIRVPNYNRPIIPSFNLNLDSLKLLDLALIVKGLAQSRSTLRT